jgi:hypothetical protein
MAKNMQDFFDQLSIFMLIKLFIKKVNIFIHNKYFIHVSCHDSISLCFDFSGIRRCNDMMEHAAF